MKYHFRIWCPDCCGSDPQGCFGGQVEDDEEEFGTPQEADEAGWEATLRTIWEYEVIDQNGNAIEVPN